MQSGPDLLQVLMPFIWTCAFLVVLLAGALAAGMRIRAQRTPALLTLAALGLMAIGSLGSTTFWAAMSMFDSFQSEAVMMLVPVVPFSQKLVTALALALVGIAAVVRTRPETP
jgi:hypothetical protein